MTDALKTEDQPERAAVDEVAKRVHAAMTYRESQPDLSLYFADWAVTAAQTEVARIEYEAATERGTAIHTAIGMRSNLDGDAEENPTYLWSAYHLRRNTEARAARLAIDEARETLAFAESAREQIDRRIRERAPQLDALR